MTSLDEQIKIIFEPIKLDSDYDFELPDLTKEIYINVESNVALNGFLFEKQENVNLMVYFQGNSKNLQNFLDNHHMVLNWGYTVLVTDYRSFGKSTGTLTGHTQMYSDADKVYDYAIKLGYKPQNIILYGYSMGTSLAGYLASYRKAKSVILESPYSSISEISWVGNKAPNFELNTVERAKRIDIPTLLVHGNKDDVISPDHSQRIYNNLKTSRKKRIIIDGGGHGDLKKRPEYKKIINNFIDKY
ncbi:MAG: alpha/beta fold hydrolase [Bacteroidales bacterium]|nr:alpha/beta fold hydrolase [Bacteroidales bacterium]